MGQPACLEENFVTKSKSSTGIASGASRPRHSPHRNPSPIDPVEDELARDPGSVEGPDLCITSLAPSHNPTSGPNLILALISAPVPAPTPVLTATDELFK